MRTDYPRAVLAAFAVAVCLALVVAASTSAASFSVYNADWDGASDLDAQAEAVGADATVVRDVAEYDRAAPEGTVAVVLSPDEAYAAAEADRVRSFVRNGGTLVVAEDVGPHANDLLAAVGADARVDGRPLRDERHNYRSPAMPTATVVANHSLVADVDALTLNHGTAVVPNGADVLVATSEYSYLDANRNGNLDDDEAMQSYPVATIESVGAGRVVVVGDPSVAINAMLDRPGNRAFARALFAGHDRVLLDYSHAVPLPPLSVAVLVLRESALLQVLVGVAAVAGVAAWRDREGLVRWVRAVVGRVRDRGETAPERPGQQSERALVDYLVEQHPDWDRERVRRLVRTTREDRPTRAARDSRENGRSRRE